MKLFFEGDSIVAQIKQSLLLRERTSKTPLSLLFVTPIEARCLAEELNGGECTHEELQKLFNEVEGFEAVELEVYQSAESR